MGAGKTEADAAAGALARNPPVGRGLKPLHIPLSKRANLCRPRQNDLIRRPRAQRFKDGGRRNGLANLPPATSLGRGPRLAVCPPKPFE